MASSTASPTVPTTADNSPIELLPTARPSQTSGINRLPVELLHMIAWSLPAAEIYDPDVPCEAWKAWEAKPSPLPSDLYPLARTCRGFWQCLSPLLYHFDVRFETAVHKFVPDRQYWVVDWPSHSALSWGIDNNQMATVKLAVGAARAIGDFEVYAGITRKRLCSLRQPDSAAVDVKRRAAAGVFLYADALFQAVLHGNVAAVRILTEEADVSMLNQPVSEWNFEFGDAAANAFDTYGHYLTGTDLTALHLAISFGHADIVEVLLTRYSQLDQSTLEWYEPIALPIAAYIGDVNMARLILDGTSSQSPWIARARSQLLDPRGYVNTCDFENPVPQPPMIMAGEGMFRAGWCQNGDEMFSFLAERGGQDLLTKASFSTDAMEIHTPLECAICWHRKIRTDRSREHGPDDARVVALIKAGALTTRTRPIIPCPPGFDSTREPTISYLWAFVGPSERLRFMGRCWDAALEHRGELDEEFVMYWADGVDYILEGVAPPTYLHDSTAQQDAIDHMEAHVALISLLESKAPGFAQHPPIRNWLDLNVFQRSSRREINFTSLKGDWRHLM